MPSDLRPLTELSLGSTATVAVIKVSPGSQARLMEMGLLVGTPIELVRFAPLGDPVEIKVRGYHLSLRKQEILRKLIGYCAEIKDVRFVIGEIKVAKTKERGKI